MELRLENGLPMAECLLSYHGKKLFIKNVLLDTGCAVSAVDIDCASLVGLLPSRDHAKIVSMYGIGGGSEYCLEQSFDDLTFDHYEFKHFKIHLGAISYAYGFDAILGADFFRQTGMILDLRGLQVWEPEKA
ncbi:hypothetical protein ACFO4N_02545 [Camelliibacillus cellulosilyticus]|uniref:Aspartyl protease n=1 Tax=Camelliibacillus cellulosilyticus TaxID=2174486 RepID=A0ABV9GLS5_9BACL